jgi:hypothetical protein
MRAREGTFVGSVCLSRAVSPSLFVSHSLLGRNEEGEQEEEQQEEEEEEEGGGDRQPGRSTSLVSGLFLASNASH